MRKDNREALLAEFFEVSQVMTRAWKQSHFALLDEAEVTLSPAQAGVLFMVEHHNQQSGQELAHKLHISKSATTQLLDGLEAEGYIARKTSAADRRVTHIVLQDKGYEMLQLLKAKRQELLSRITRSMTDQELAEANKIFATIASALAADNNKE